MPDFMNDKEFSLFQDMADTGVGETLKALSKISQNAWLLFPKKLNFVSIENAKKMFPKQESVRFGGDLNLEGDAPLSLLYIFPQESAINLTHYMAGMAKIKRTDLSSLEVLAIAELSNILGNSFVNVLANTLNMRMLPSLPRVMSDARGVLLSKAIDRAKINAEYVLTTDMKIETGHMTMSGTFCLILSGDSLKKIAAKIRQEPTLKEQRMQFF